MKFFLQLALPTQFIQNEPLSRFLRDAYADKGRHSIEGDFCCIQRKSLSRGISAVNLSRGISAVNLHIEGDFCCKPVLLKTLSRGISAVNLYNLLDPIADAIELRIYTVINSF